MCPTILCGTEDGMNVLLFANEQFGLDRIKSEFTVELDGCNSMRSGPRLILVFVLRVAHTVLWMHVPLRYWSMTSVRRSKRIHRVRRCQLELASPPFSVAEGRGERELSHRIWSHTQSVAIDIQQWAVIETYESGNNETANRSLWTNRCNRKAGNYRQLFLWNTRVWNKTHWLRCVCFVNGRTEQRRNLKKRKHWTFACDTWGIGLDLWHG